MEVAIKKKKNTQKSILFLPLSLHSYLLFRRQSSHFPTQKSHRDRSKICTSFIRAEWHVSVECLAWLCPQTRVGQFLRDLLLKTMMTIQEDGNITDRSDYIKGDIILGAPNTPYIDGKITKQSQRDAHTQRCYRPEILGELGTKTPLSLSPCIEQKNSSVMQVFQESKSCSNCFYIVICCVSDPVLPLTSISKTTFFFKWGYWAA